MLHPTPYTPMPLGPMYTVQLKERSLAPWMNLLSPVPMRCWRRLLLLWLGAVEGLCGIVLVQEVFCLVSE